MFTSIVVTILTVLHLVRAQNYQYSALLPAAVTIPEDGSRCPSQQQREITLQQLQNNVRGVLANFNDAGGDRSPQPQCGEGEWTQVTYLNMSVSSQQCPSVWREYNTNGVRACGRQNITSGGCDGTFHGTGSQYSKVCGRVIGYQYGPTEPFNSGYNVNMTYVDGVSITHGTQRAHIWTLASAYAEESSGHCPCVGLVSPPSFIGDNYYCESGTNTAPQEILYTNDPLWDGEQCEGRCCSDGRTPPWFSVDLPNPTTDDIEVRICAGNSDEDTPIGLLELYIQ